MKQILLKTAACLASTALLNGIFATAAVEKTSAADSKITPQLLTAKNTYDGQPSMCKTADGKVWTAWVAYDFPLGDKIMVAGQGKDGAWSKPEEVNAQYGQIVRPTISALGDEVAIFWTDTTATDLAKVMFAKRENGKWSAPECISAPGVSAQNQEAASDGKKVLVAWQEFRGGNYDIVTREFSGGKWHETASITQDKYDDWDPAIVRDSSGKFWVSWTSYRDGDYDVYIRRADKKDAKETRLSARGEYDLHPSLAADDKGGVWVAWDSVTIPRHGWSGSMTITGANLKKYADQEMNDPENPDQKALVAQIRVVCVQDGKILQIPKTSKALTPPAPHRLAHTALPKISVDKNGAVWVGYRALYVDAPADEQKPSAKNAGKGKGEGKNKKTQQANANSQQKKKKQRHPYWWDVFVQSFQGGQWSEPTKLPESDGTSEEVALTPAAHGIEVAYEMEHRKANAPAYQALLSKEPQEEEGDHHHDYGKVLGSNGDVYVVAFETSSKTEPAAKSLVARKAPLDKEVKPRLPREEAHYQTEINGKKYTLLWGDLHKHSNISRCSSGNEPSPEDHYKYAHDICQYDFLAMSDHAEHTTDYNWWRIQKLADLYNIPGAFSVLYGYEWSASWPVGHHNVIWASRPSPLLRCNLEGTRNTKELWETLAKSGKQALTIPHTSADPRMGTRWDIHDERYERVCEMFQACRGSYEYDGCPRQHVNATAKGGFVQDGLAKDYRLGMICSSDHGWGTAYAVVYATENSRQAAWQGLYDRRCYGSTTYGLVVDFRIGEHFMGEEFSTDKPEKISVYARGTAPIREIAIFSNGKLVHNQGDVKNPIGKKEVKLEWTPESLSSGTTYFYARIIQEDDEMAWTSPVWVTSRNLKVSEAK